MHEKLNLAESSTEETRIKEILPIPVREKRPNPLNTLRSLGLTSLLALTPVEHIAAEEVRGMSPEERSVIESVLGADVIEQWEEQGFTVSIPVMADKNGSYIIHVGQFHPSPFTGIQRILTNETAATFQARLYGLLPSIIDAERNGVFTEGISSDMSSSRDYVRSLKIDLEMWSNKEITNIDEAKTVADLLSNYAGNKGHDFVIAHISPSVAAKVAEALTIFIDSYTPVNEEEEYRMEMLHIDIQMLSLTNIANLMTGTPEDASAVARLYFDGVIELVPSELPEVNQRAMEAAQREKDAQRAYGAGRREAVFEDPQLKTLMEEVEPLFQKEQAGTISVDETIRLVELRREATERFDMLEKQYLEESPQGLALQAAEAEAERIIMTEREEVVLEKIAAYQAEHGVGHQIVVFGSAHQFGQEVRARNATNNPIEPDLGLIEIKINEMSEE